MVSETQLRTASTQQSLRSRTRQQAVQEGAYQQRVATAQAQQQQYQQQLQQQTENISSSISQKQAELNRLESALATGTPKVMKVGVTYITGKRRAEYIKKIAKLKGELTYLKEAKQISDTGAIVQGDISSAAAAYSLSTPEYQRAKYALKKKEAKSISYQERQKLEDEAKQTFEISKQLPPEAQKIFLEQQGYKVIMEKPKPLPTTVTVDGQGYSVAPELQQQFIEDTRIKKSSSTIDITSYSKPVSGKEILKSAVIKSKEPQMLSIGAYVEEKETPIFKSSFGSALLSSGRILAKKIFTGEGKIEDVLKPFDVATKPPIKEEVVVGSLSEKIGDAGKYIDAEKLTKRQKELLGTVNLGIKTKEELIKEQRTSLNLKVERERKAIQTLIDRGELTLEEGQKKLKETVETVQSEYKPIELKERKSPIRTIVEIGALASPVTTFTLGAVQAKSDPLIVSNIEDIKSGKLSIGGGVTRPLTTRTAITFGIGTIGAYGELQKAGAAATEVRIESAAQAIKRRPLQVYGKQTRVGKKVTEIGRFKAVGDNSYAEGIIRTESKLVGKNKIVLSGESQTTIVTREFFSGRPIILKETRQLTGSGFILPKTGRISPSIFDVESGLTERAFITGKEARRVIDLTGREPKIITRGGELDIRIDRFTKPTEVQRNIFGQGAEKIKIGENTFIYSKTGRLDKLDVRIDVDTFKGTIKPRISKLGFPVEEKGLTLITKSPKLSEGLSEITGKTPAKIIKTPFAKTFGREYPTIFQSLKKLDITAGGGDILLTTSGKEIVKPATKFIEVGQSLITPSTSQLIIAPTTPKIIAGVETTTLAPLLLKGDTKLEVKPSIIERSLIRTPTREIESNIIQPKPKKDTKTFDDLITGTSEGVKIDSTQVEALVPQQLQQQEQITSQAQLLSQTNINIGTSTIKPFDIDIPEQTPLIDRIKRVAKKQEIFKGFVRKGGKDIEFGTFLSKESAVTGLKRKLRGTLRASGFIEKGGKKLKVSDLGILNGEFTTSKKEQFRLVQRKERRLGSFGETEELQFFKKKKKGKKGRNLFGL